MNPFVYELQIKEHHLDTFGHVNNATYLALMEEARWELLTGNGFGMAQIKESGLGPVILEVQIQFRRELRLRDRVRIITKMISYEGKVGELEQEILDTTGQVSASARFKFGLFDTRSRRLVAPTPAWNQAIGWSN